MTGLPALLKIGQAAQRLGVGMITIRAWVRHDPLSPGGVGQRGEFVCGAGGLRCGWGGPTPS